MANKSEEPEEKDEPSRGKNALEWIIFGVSLILVFGVLSYLTWQTISSASRPARLEITLGEPVKAKERVLIPVIVKNLGDATAAGVEVEVTRKKSDEKANFSLPYVPREGSRKGWVVFDGPLDKADLKAQVLGYEEP